MGDRPLGDRVDPGGGDEHVADRGGADLAAMMAKSSGGSPVPESMSNMQGDPPKASPASIVFRDGQHGMALPHGSSTTRDEVGNQGSHVVYAGVPIEVSGSGVEVRFFKQVSAISRKTTSVVK